MRNTGSKTQEVTSTTNRVIGNNFEDDFANLLFEKGFWVKKLAQTQQGQPADILAVKNHKAYLIDCKVCSGDKGFPVSRIEPNQDTAMDLWRDCGNGEGWFAFKFEYFGREVIFLLTHLSVKALRDNPYRTNKYITYDEIMSDGVYLEQWLKKK